ncbi:hypothetical protein SAMN05443633_10413 [Chryseobacterium arachidis]|uniref:Cell-wall binding lipoprotein n=2 Tax=Chryseobacterium arachidis TaxID=1416778 RepID=A0A1M5B2P9_9FLAO|nr:hypothetical protein SAMN05443633_10413 [Chryseobacterium arachidis]
MIAMKKIFLTSTLFLLIISCGENKSENRPIVENAVDNSESSISSIKNRKLYARESNMVEQIYAEIMKNNKNLQNLDRKFIQTTEESEKVTSQYDHIIYKNENYYNDAQQLTRTITDSILKKEIENEIKVSSEKYNLKIKRIKDLIVQVDKNRMKLNDQYTFFKVRKTLPEIEKYQKAHPLKTDSLENFIRKQNQLLIELKNLK